MKPPKNNHPWGRALWPLLRGWPLLGGFFLYEPPHPFKHQIQHCSDIIMFIGGINNSIDNLLSVRGYHACLYLWEPTIGEVLQAKPEPTNSEHNRAVAVLQDGVIVGHVPFNLASRLFQFLRRDVNKAFVRGESKPRCRLWTGNSMYYYYYDLCMVANGDRN